MAKELLKPDYLFEISWEVCNKIGGIHTLISTKSSIYKKDYGDNYIFIGPDVFRDESEHPEFEEDVNLHKEWRNYAAAHGISVKIGRWKIMSKPVAILVDFSKLINQKDEIFSKYWETFRLDSLSGQWDYIEPALFGYAAGRTIESFINFYFRSTDKAIAHFHEWLSGMGVLYVKENLPRIASVYTAHSTVIGRSWAADNQDLYKALDNNIQTAEVAKKLNVTSKYSLEKLSAQNSDIFATISNITAKECTKILDKSPDIITPNGFDEQLIPKNDILETKRDQARELIKYVSEKVLGNPLSDKALFIATSGRYEFRNKGIDAFLDALGKLNTSADLGREIVALVLVPANHYGPRKELRKILDTNEDTSIDHPYITHNLHYIDNDPIITSMARKDLNNDISSKVKVIFVPAYLDGNDGIFNINYYDLLIGLDLTVFPSYYEPWGYTSLESLVFKVPTITSSLSGFGNWISDKIKTPDEGFNMVQRNDNNYQQVVDEIASMIIKHSKFNDEQMLITREKAATISKMVLWKNFIDQYHEIYQLALKEVDKRDGYRGLKRETPTETVQQIKHPVVNPPNWKRITVLSSLPEKLSKLNEIIRNLWWTWDCKTLEMFEEIDPLIWKESEQNPILLFEKVDYQRLRELENDKEFIRKVDSAYQRFKDYMDKSEKTPPKVAYFSMEFGLHESLKIYSGGLGILAGDYLKQASDSNIDMVAIGLLYRYGYFKQLLSINGEQIVSYESEDFSKIPITPVRDKNGKFLTITVVLPGRKLHARIWKVAVGRITLYLLDTDFDANAEQDRFVTHNLYGGDQENRLKQEILLGIGGIRALEELGIHPDIYHSNEGHSAFCGLERLRILINNENLTFWEAKEVVRSSTLFTTHTPVPAGHDSFSEELLRTYIAHYPGRLKITWDELMALGRANPNDRNEKFNMSFLAAHLAQETNGVSLLHGAVTREMFAKLWPGYLADELYIGHVTNGVHYPTWTAQEFRKLYSNNFGDFFEEDQTNSKLWTRIHDVDDQEVWEIKQTLKKRLITYIKDRFRDNWIKRHENPQQIIEVFDNLKEDRLTIAFARRFATYKRAQLLFNNLERLSEIINNSERPVQFLFAGKAHPHDKMGQELIRLIVDISKRPEFIGKILFLQNYDMELARKLVQGVDIWINTPTRPLEASGTSGQKAAMNGTPHFSVLDGWWVEGYRDDAGWALPKERTYENQDFQDKLDAETIYSILENEILPVYYDRDSNNIPRRWIEYIKNTIAYVAPKFTTTRMITDYKEKYYEVLYKRSKSLIADEFQVAKEIAYWKNDISKHWDKIEVLDTAVLKKDSEHYEMGKEYTAKVTLDLGELTPDDIGVEIIMTNDFADIVQQHEFELTKKEGSKAYYSMKLNPLRPGTFNYGLRIFPKHHLLPHRQDFGYLKWI